jgi:hypothetical protein
MSRERKMAIWAVVIAVFIGILITVLRIHRHRGSTFLRGVVIRQNADPQKELPIADVQIKAVTTLSEGECKSDITGFFNLILSPGIVPWDSATVQFRHPEYLSLDLVVSAEDKLYVVRMAPVPTQTRAQPSRPEILVANISARYSIKATTAANIGNAVKTFQVINTGNIPCNGRQPCSPDGKWKATIGSVFLDAGEGNEFRNARVSCIAGPCPFTKMEFNGFSRGGRTITASVRNWSDTTTFLVEAEVFRPMVTDYVRRSYPAIFDGALNFTLPAGAEGVCIQAEVNGEAIVFPLGPNLFLSWADCIARVSDNQTKVYRCELKPGYRFP